MAVAIGPVLLILASILLGAALLLAAFGILLWTIRHHRKTRDEVQGTPWKHDPTDLAGRKGTSIAAPGK